MAELVGAQNGRPMVRDNYVPPVLHIAAAPFLSSGLQRVLAAITARQRQLVSERKQRQTGSVDFHATDARRFWLLHTLNGVIPHLTHLLDVTRVHPEEAYLLLASLIGQLSTSAPDADPMSVPKFNYSTSATPSRSCSRASCRSFREASSNTTSRCCSSIAPMACSSGSFPNPKLVANEFFFAVKASLAEALIRERVPAVMKMAGWNHIYEVVKQARHGVRVDIEWNPRRCFRSNRASASSASGGRVPTGTMSPRRRHVALYVPAEPDWRDASISLYAVDPVYLAEGRHSP